MGVLVTVFFFFFFNDTATTEIYTLSLHDALPIYSMTTQRNVHWSLCSRFGVEKTGAARVTRRVDCCADPRSEEHTSELQSLAYLVCRLLLEKKKVLVQTAQVDREAVDLVANPIRH